MEKISKPRFYFALFALWMYSIYKDAGKITDKYIKQKKDNEFTRF